jgi:hypothetical protein
MHFRITHDFDVTPEIYFGKIHFDDEYNRRLHKAMALKEYSVFEKNEDEKELRRKIRVVPERDIPSMLKKIVGDAGLSYTEISTFHKKEYRIDWKVITDIMKDKVDSHGHFLVAPLGQGRCRREVDGVVEVKVFGVGGMVEKLIVENLQDSYEKAAQTTIQFIKEKGLAAT